MKNQPIQIVDSKDHKFLLNDLEKVERILGTDELRGHELVVVSIAGAFRYGKSFLLNYFLRYLDAQYKRHDVKDWIGRNESGETLDGFSWRGGKERNTIGIWMWSEVFTHDFRNGDKVAIILMDTQGIFDTKSSLKECISTFAISMLLSSVQCYNIMHQVQEDDLTHLQLFTEYAKYAMEGTDEKPFQKLLFVVRDWQSPIDHEFGPSKKYVVDDILAKNDEQTAEQHELRDEIKKSFDDIDAFLMPYPGKDVAQQRKIENHRLQLDKEFENCVEMLTEQLLAPEKLIRKKVGGVTIQAAAFLTYLEEYVKVFSGNEAPDPKTVLESTRDAQMLAFHKECFVEYENGMKKEAGSADVCFEDEELQQKHEATMKMAIALFENKKMLGGAEKKALAMNKLQIAIKKRYEEIKELNRIERETINSRKNWTFGGIATGFGLVGAVASIIATGPIGLFAYGVAAVRLTSLAGGSGAGVGAALKWLAPRSWFGNKDALKEKIEESQKDDTEVNSG